MRGRQEKTMQDVGFLIWLDKTRKRRASTIFYPKSPEIDAGIVPCDWAGGRTRSVQRLQSEAEKFSATLAVEFIGGDSSFSCPVTETATAAAAVTLFVAAFVVETSFQERDIAHLLSSAPVVPPVPGSIVFFHLLFFFLIFG